MPRSSPDFKPIQDSPLSLADLKMCERFKKIMVEKGLTQPEYAHALGLTLSSVKAIQTGRYAPTVEVLRRIRRKFHISYDFLIDG